MPSRLKTSCCSGVGLASIAARAPRPMRTMLRVSVARSCNSVRKLCTGRPSWVRLRAALVLAAVETLALATGERRADASGEAMVDRAHLQFDGFDGAEGATWARLL